MCIGRTVSRFLFYLVIYLRNLPPGIERVALLPLRVFQYTWSCWSWCRHRRMSPHGVVSSCLTVSPLPLSGGLFSVTAFIRLLPSVLSTAGYSAQSGLSSEACFSDKSFYLYFKELFVSELALDSVIFSVHALHLFPEGGSDVLAILVALHGP